MIGSGFIDELDADICGDFFDQIDDLLNFPSEDIQEGFVGGKYDGFQGVWPAPPDSFPGSASFFSGNCTNSSSELPTEFAVPYEEIAQLEWLSNFFEDSSPGSIPLDKDSSFSAGSIPLDKDSSSSSSSSSINNKKKNTYPFQTSSSVSVLESSSSSSSSSSSCSEGKMTPLNPETLIRGRARSKRPRPATFNPRPMISLISPTSSITDLTSELPSELENFAESHPATKIPKPAATENKKKKKKKLLPPSGATEQWVSPQPIAVRKCLHCEITKTPQWRAGPMGPKTLCNACGVRYKSGRLYPEYRPAASPTFVASLHSNSHKKVLEMRIKDDEKMTTAATVTTPPPDFMPNSSHLLDYISGWERESS